LVGSYNLSNKNEVKQMRIGFDLDGVLCKIDVGLLRVIDNMQPEANKSAEEWYYRERKPELNPLLFMSKDDEMIIITSRPKRLEYITIPWVKRYFPNTKLIQTDHETYKGSSKEELKNWLKEMANTKAIPINKEKIDVYFEDSPSTVQQLRKLCPNTKIIHYGGRW